jgi:rhodanese-related sulfurtransferase
MGWMRAGKPIAAAATYPDVAIPLIRSKELARLPQGPAVLVDIRPAENYQNGHIANSLNIDLEVLQDRLDLLTPEKTIILIDHKGKLTLTTGRFLSANGFGDIVRLDGGINAWIKTGLPVVQSGEIVRSKE